YGPIDQLKEIEARALLNKLHIPMFKIPFILRQAKRLMHKEMLYLKPFPMIPNMLSSLHQMGFHLSIVSSNSEENISKWLKQHDIFSYFHFIHNAPQYFGKSSALKSTIKKYQLDKKKVLYIGDEVRDIEAAKRSGMLSLGVTWGYNNERIIRKSQPHFIASTPDEIIQIVNDNMDQ
ncbi:MAG TPA: HAD-IA family hydrolase, partial [Legionellaceae bacterium]|nr:HAD-IA family hydrolase [Legionellaceae bacterium]